MADKVTTGASENGQQPTPAAEWRKPREEGFTLTLPSGNRVVLRPVALDVLITTGAIPDTLSPIAAKSLWAEKKADEIAEQEELAEAYARLVNVIVPAALKYPRVRGADGDDADPDDLADDEILLEDLDFEDKVAVFNLAIAPTEAIRRFRDGQERAVSAVHDGDEDGDEAE